MYTWPLRIHLYVYCVSFCYYFHFGIGQGLVPWTVCGHQGSIVHGITRVKRGFMQAQDTGTEINQHAKDWRAWGARSSRGNLVVFVWVPLWNEALDFNFRRMFVYHLFIEMVQHFFP